MTHRIDRSDRYLWTEHTHSGCSVGHSSSTGMAVATLNRLLQLVPEVEQLATVLVVQGEVKVQLRWQNATFVDTRHYLATTLF